MCRDFKPEVWGAAEFQKMSPEDAEQVCGAQRWGHKRDQGKARRQQ